ncbi:hypothetical protein [uncultured Limosilactobacillus sp.]|uniref:hypothetical protein n=1 Tax=uncultured Limosilactobacillus sp. TaxID=2837629 RepID=UPI0025CF38BC|nr:hypothetical protein [uncultured Limosilactobacillus sp.]
MIKINITPLLQHVIAHDWQVMDNLSDEVAPLGADGRLDNTMTCLLVSLSRTVTADGWFDKVNQPVKQQSPVNHSQLLTNYCRTLNLFLLWSAKRQWTHLVVLGDDDWQRLTEAKLAEKVTDKNKQYLAIVRLLGNVQFSHQQESFRHAWHLFLKMGLVDWQLTPAEISTTSQQLAKL